MALVYVLPNMYFSTCGMHTTIGMHTTSAAWVHKGTAGGTVTWDFINRLTDKFTIMEYNY